MKNLTEQEEPLYPTGFTPKPTSPDEINDTLYPPYVDLTGEGADNEVDDEILLPPLLDC